MTTEPYVIPLRKTIDRICTAQYCTEYDNIALALRIDAGGEKSGCGPASVSKRANYIGINICIVGTDHDIPDGIPTVLPVYLREAVEKIITKAVRAGIDLKVEQFRHDMHKTLEEYE